ncbi:glycosyltransferase family 2 protein [Actinomyces sp. oral taxon 897]|uniref:glycosyltransferase family 2 protein n=1 Tax=Actinomyces sp. oral taxon 897 TaxID=2081702 RepID=UPI00101AECD2|nr:glycosyltransferase family 2 protein [Actinomyces sp. oral taxon 897]
MEPRPVRRRLGARAQVGQFNWYRRQVAETRMRPEMRQVARGMRLPRLRLRRRVTGSVWAVTMVRDEKDILPSVITHLLDQGVDHVLVADNLSQDGTYEYLRDLARRDPRVHVGRDTTVAYYQSAKMSYLARAAWRAGADWVVPFDADELWFAREGSLTHYLRGLDADVVGADWYDMVLLDDGPVGPTSSFLLDTTPNPLGKVAFRSHPLALLEIGNHGVARVGTWAQDGLAVAHARYRSQEQVARKFRQGAQALAATGLDSHYGGHWRQGAQASDEELARMWEGMRRGEPEPRVHWFATGPMVRVRPVSWSCWELEAAAPRS